MKKQMTLKEALEAGYTHYGRDTEDFQSLHALDGLDDGEIEDEAEDGCYFVLAEKDPYHHSIKATDIIEWASDSYYNNEDIGDDTDMIEDLLKKQMPWFEEVAQRLNAIYAQRETFGLTDIQIIPEGHING